MTWALVAQHQPFFFSGSSSPCYIPCQCRHSLRLMSLHSCLPRSKTFHVVQSPQILQTRDLTLLPLCCAHALTHIFYPLLLKNRDHESHLCNIFTWMKYCHAKTFGASLINVLWSHLPLFLAEVVCIRSVPQSCKFSQLEKEKFSISGFARFAPCALLNDWQEHCSWGSCFCCFSGQQFADVGRYHHDEHQFLPLHSTDPCPAHV